MSPTRSRRSSTPGGRATDQIDGHPDQTTARRHRNQPSRVHVQPDELRQAPGRRCDHEHAGREQDPGDAVPGHELQRRSKFAPKFAVSTAGHTSKALGASLTAKVSIPSAAQGTYANIARVKVDLPMQLPSQLKTLQKACLAKTFEEGFEKCLKQAPDSKIGEAVVHTPILARPAVRPGDLRQPRRRSVPDPDDRAAGRRHHDRPRRQHVHPRRDHDHHVQDGPRHPVQHASN